MQTTVEQRIPPTDLSEYDCLGEEPEEATTFGELFDERDAWKKAARICYAQTQQWRSWALGDESESDE